MGFLHSDQRMYQINSFVVIPEERTNEVQEVFNIIQFDATFLQSHSGWSSLSTATVSTSIYFLFQSSGLALIFTLTHCKILQSQYCIWFIHRRFFINFPTVTYVYKVYKHHHCSIFFVLHKVFHVPKLFQHD